MLFVLQTPRVVYAAKLRKKEELLAGIQGFNVKINCCVKDSTGSKRNIQPAKSLSEEERTKHLGSRTVNVLR